MSAMKWPTLMTFSQFLEAMPDSTWADYVAHADDVLASLDEMMIFESPSIAGTRNWKERRARALEAKTVSIISNPAPGVLRYFWGRCMPFVIDKRGERPSQTTVCERHLLARHLQRAVLVQTEPRRPLRYFVFVRSTPSESNAGRGASFSDDGL
ncbi:hypothetical protein BC832DRAFT_219329 [Gaertneriomyces semiglobifer]|nr:hypothetical protein BC832DRAFT_219329 [Gaertneriomyces semiglobifer]